MIDLSLDKFAPTFFQNYFDWGVPQTTLTYVTAIGRSRIEAAASVVSRDSKSPLRSRPALDKLNGEIPAIKEMFAMTESDYRNFLMLQSLNISDAVKKNQMLDLLFGDTKRVGDAAMKRLDYMVLEGLSTGKITITATNNPDGIAPGTIDLLMPSDNKTTAAVDWGTSSTATPITDITNVINNQAAKGRSFAKILMTRAKWLQFSKTKEVTDSIQAFYGVVKGVKAVTLTSVNEFLTENQFPTIEIVDHKIGVEQDGKIVVKEPFNTDNVVLVPSGKLGVIHNALAIEELQPVKALTYAKFNNALISKWQDNEPFGEWTKVELNAFPGFDAIDGIAIIDTTP